MSPARSPEPRRSARFRLNPVARAWLRSGEEGTSGGEEGPDWSVWLLGRLAANRVIDIGGVMVDRAVLEQRFACVSQRCAPGARARGMVSCCADVELTPTAAECKRLARAAPELEGWLQRREPRLRGAASGFWLSENGAGLCRPQGRCVFSAIDAQGRIRCRLHAYAKERAIPRERIQPLSCRLFPLIVVDRGGGRVALTVVGRGTCRLASTHRPEKYPCLADPGLPYLTESMGADLDWMFGEGFARALAAARRGL